MKRPSTHDRLLAFGLTTGVGCVRRSSDGQHVAWVDPAEAQYLVELLERGVRRELAVRVIEAKRAKARAAVRVPPRAGGAHPLNLIVLENFQLGARAPVRGAA